VAALGASTAAAAVFLPVLVLVFGVATAQSTVT
jgi:fumarate reductase subunit D